MTDENQNSGGETSNEPKFGEGETQQPEVKFGTEDVTKLAKMNSDAQAFITELKGETKDLRDQVKAMQEELARSKTIDDLIELQQQEKSVPESKAPQIDKNELLAELEARMSANLTQAQVEAKQESNWQTSLSMAEEQFGEGYVDYVTDKAQQLDISVKDMEQYAKTSPKVFMELLGGKKAAPTPTQSTHNAPTGGSTASEHFERIAKLKSSDTPEGRAARNEWQDPEFQKKYREHILAGLK